MANNKINKTDECMENVRIIVEKCVSESRLYELGVKSWPKWACSPGKYKLKYDAKETCYLVKGKVRAICGNNNDQDCVEFEAGDLVFIPKGLSCTWDVSIAVDKFYNFDNNNNNNINSPSSSSSS